MILAKNRDPRFITLRRGGTLTDADHRLLALWAATCAEHVLHLFESMQPSETLRTPHHPGQAREGFSCILRRYDNLLPNRRGDGKTTRLSRLGAEQRLLQTNRLGEEDVVLQMHVLLGVRIELLQQRIKGAEGGAGVIRRGVTAAQARQLG